MAGGGPASSTQQPALAMAEDDYEYLDYLAEQRSPTLRGNPPGTRTPSYDPQFYGYDNGYENTPLTMAATAPDFVPRSRAYSQRIPKNPTAENPVDEYWQKNRPVLQKTDWSSVHVKLPVVAPTTASTKIKNSIFVLLTNRLEAAEGDWKDKTELFASVYNDHVPAADIEASLAIADMSNYSTNVFQFLDFQFLDSDYRALPPGAAIDYTARTRENCRYLKFTLLANPRAINSAGMNVAADQFPTQVTTTVYIRALRHDDSLHPHITKALIEQTPKYLINIYENAGQDFSLCQKTYNEAAPNPDAQTKWLSTLKAKTKYAAMKQLIKSLYVGRLEGTERLASRIERIRQRGWDATEKRFKYKSVTELSQEYQFELQEVTETMAPDELPDLENAFYRALSSDLQTKIIDYIHPIPPISVIQNIARFNEFISLCLQEEKSLKTITSVAERAVARQSRNTYQNRPPPNKGPRTFTTLPGPDGQMQLPPLGDQPALPPSPYEPNPYAQAQYAQRTYPHQQQFGQQQQPAQHSPYHNPNQHSPQGYQHLPQRQNAYNPQNGVVLPYAFICSPATSCTQQQQETLSAAIIAMDEACQTLTAVSIVEEALQNASGMRAPMKCFGCDGLPEYQNNCYHMWRNCPNKNDSRTWTNFQHNLKAFRDRKRDAPRNDDPNWSRAGYPNQHVRDQFQAIANPTTSASTRRVMIATLSQELQDPEPTNNESQDTPVKKRRSRRIARNFLMYSQPQVPPAPKTFLGAPPLSRYEFKIAYKLPFLKFPIGDGQTSEDCATLSGLADTGGCCNMGWLPYHQEIARKYPHLVHEFVNLEEKQYENINIGGLQGGVALTHMIKYFIPYTDQGGGCVITLGLTEDLPIDTLFGVNFQTEAKMQIDLAGRKIWSGYFQDSYELEFKEPKRTNIAHVASQTDRHPKALATHKEE
jgi:hypothetical protein